MPIDIKKNMSLFREFIKGNQKYAMIYSNSTSSFAEKNFREQVFKIKSDLAHDKVKDDKLYISINLWRAITRIFTDYVIGNWIMVDFNEDEANQTFIETSDEIWLQISLDEWVSNQSSIGYWILRLREDEDWEIRVDVIPLPNYCAIMEWLGIWDWFMDIKEHFIFSIQKNKQTGKRFFYVDRYEKQEDGSWKWYYGEERDYNSNFILTKKIKEWEEEPLNFFPLYLFNNDLDNPHVVSDETDIKTKNDVWEIPRYFHQSDYRDIIDILQEINDRESQISVEFIKNLTSKLSVPAGFASAQTAKAMKERKEGKDPRFSENPDYLVHNPWETPAQYIVKDATYVQATINDYMPMLFKLITCLTTVPAILLSNAIYGGNTPVGTTDKEFEPFYKRVGKKQQLLYSSLQRLCRDIMKMKWFEVGLPTIKFIKPTANDIATKATTAIQLVNAGIMSKESALSFIMWYDETEVKEEMDKIAQEEKDSYAKYQAFNLDSNDKNEWTNNEEQS